LDEHSAILNHHTDLLKEINETLKNFMEVSIQQFQQQLTFNERFMAQFEKQNKFNELFLSKLDEISKKP